MTADGVAAPDTVAAPAEAAVRTSGSTRADRRAAAWWPIAWYPTALPVAYIIAIWSASAIHPTWLVTPILITVTVVLLVTLFMSLVLGDSHRGGVATAALTVALLLTHDVARTGLLVLAAVIVGEGLLYRGRRWRNGRRITRFLSVFGAFLVIVAFGGAIVQGSLQDGVADVRADLDARHAEAFDPAAPDIYVMLLDGYPGDDAATLDPTFDANAFPAALAARGFDVERHARTNYLTTRVAVATMLANQHVNAATELAPPRGSQAADARRLREFGDDGIVLRSLRDAGYETITVTSPAAHLGLRRVDRVIDPPGPSEFDRALLAGIGLGPILDGIAPDLFAAIARGQILSTFDSAEAVAAEPHDRPRFVWMHVLAPHPPLLFRADGTPITNVPALQMGPRARETTADRSARISETFDYAEFVAHRTEQMLDRMLASAKRESVIFIFSDHGTDIDFDASDPLASDLDERTSIILAVRTPGHRDLLPPGTTPIGVLPRILNAYLGTSLPIRSDTIWGWPRNGSLLDAVPIDPGSFEK
jgi:hypothetical protein